MDDGKINFLLNTIQALAENGKNGSEVRWVGLRDGSKKCSWQEFCKFANIEIDEHYDHIHEDLVVVGDDWYLKRNDDDSFYFWWSFETLPILKDDPDELTGDDFMHFMKSPENY